MSNAIVNRIRSADLPPTEKFILWIISDIANDAGFTADYAPIPRLQKESGFSRQTVISAIKRLEDQNIIKADRSNGRLTAYSVNPEYNINAAKPVNLLYGYNSYTGQSVMQTSLTDQDNQSNWHMQPVKEVDSIHHIHHIPLIPQTPDAEKTEKQDKPKKQKPRLTAMPKDFELSVSPAVKAWAEKNGHTNLEAHLEHFVGYAKARGATYANWDQALMNAIRGDWAKLKGKTWQQPTISQPVNNTPMSPAHIPSTDHVVLDGRGRAQAAEFLQKLKGQKA